MITCQISDIVQGFDLQRKEQKTYAVLILPGGKQIRVPVSEDDAAAIIAVAMSDDTPAEYNQPPTSAKQNGAFTHGTAPDGSTAMIFGAQAAAHEVVLADQAERKIGDLPSIEEELQAEKVPVTPIETGSSPPATKMKARLVGVDEKGNPIMEYPNGVDPHRVIGGPSANADEDGVQQL